MTHNNRILTALLFILCFYASLAFATSSAAPSSAASPVTGVVTAQKKSHSSDIHESTAVLNAQLSEMRRSEDRLLSTVHWSLGVVVALALGLSAFSWWSSNKLYQRDLKHVQEDILTKRDSKIQILVAEETNRVSEANQERLIKLQSEMIAHTMGYIADIRLEIGNVSGSIDAAFEQIRTAKIGNPNYVTQALEILTKAFSLAHQESITIDDEKIHHVCDIVESAALGDKRIQELKEVLKKNYYPRCLARRNRVRQEEKAVHKQIFKESEKLTAELYKIIDLPLFDSSDRIVTSDIACSMAFEHWDATR